MFTSMTIRVLSRYLLGGVVAGVLFVVGSATPVRAMTELTLGLVPSEDAEAMIADSRPLLSFLEKDLSVKVKPFVATDYGGVIEAMRSGHVDVAWFGGFSYVLAAQLAGAEAFAVPVPKKTGIAAYSSCIFVRSDSSYKTLADLKGKTFALVDPSSTSGNMFPRTILKLNGIEEAEKYFSRVVYSGSHNASLLSLKNGKIDAVGSNPEISLTNMIKNKQIDEGALRTILCSDPIPNSPFALRKSLDESLKDKIRDAFYKMKNINFAEYGVVTEFRKAKDTDYDVIRAAAKLMNLNLK